MTWSLLLIDCYPSGSKKVFNRRSSIHLQWFRFSKISLGFHHNKNISSSPNLTACITRLNDLPADFTVLILLILEATSGELSEMRNSNSDLFYRVFKAN